MSHSDRLNIAVFIDFDNIEIGVKNTLGQQFDPGAVLDAIKERGEVVSKVAYADWTRAGDYSRTLTQHAIRLVQRNLTPGGDKNGGDINLALDALEMVFTHTHINAYVIVGGDSDFLSLVEKLKQYDKKVFIVGGRQFTSMILQRNCHEFIAYENLSGVRKNARQSGRPMPAAAMATAPIAQAFPIVRRALKILSDREVTPQTGLLKSTLLQLDSTFSERNYGASSFLDFVEKLAQPGFVTMKTSGRSVMVELNEAFDVSSVPDAAQAPAAAASEGVTPEAAQPPSHGSGGPAPSRAAHGAPSGESGGQAPAGPPLGDNAEGVRVASRILAAARNARWPMYLRNVKQILRQAEGGFDERRYGFGGLMDLLRACQKEGLVRVERDRRGGLRVFQGGALQLQSPAAAVAPVINKANLPQADVEDTEYAEYADAQPGQSVAAPEPVETERPGAEPMPVDTTAELLGRAKPKPGRKTRAPRLGATPAAAKKAAAKKPSTRKKKSAAAEDHG